MLQGYSTAMAPLTIHDRLFRREINGASAYKSTNVRSVYGDKRWVYDLDIVNELDGHSGCVNALSYVLSSLPFSATIANNVCTDGPKAASS